MIASLAARLDEHARALGLELPSRVPPGLRHARLEAVRELPGQLGALSPDERHERLSAVTACGEPGIVDAARRLELALPAIDALDALRADDAIPATLREIAATEWLAPAYVATRLRVAYAPRTTPRQLRAALRTLERRHPIAGARERACWTAILTLDLVRETDWRWQTIDGARRVLVRVLQVMLAVALIFALRHACGTRWR